MKCPDCGIEMEEGTVENFGGSFKDYYEFTSKTEKEKTGIKGFFRDTVIVPSWGGEYPAWHCPKCKKVLMWLDSKE